MFKKKQPTTNYTFISATLQTQGCNPCSLLVNGAQLMMKRNNDLNAFP